MGTWSSPVGTWSSPVGTWSSPVGTWSSPGTLWEESWDNEVQSIALNPTDTCIHHSFASNGIHSIGYTFVSFLLNQ